jgi:sialate O-acetylesterase
LYNLFASPISFGTIDIACATPVDAARERDKEPEMRAPFLPFCLTSWCAFFPLACSAQAEAAPAAVFADHMVLQHGKPVPIWGWADRGDKVTVQFAGQTKTAAAGRDGRWMVVLDPLELNTQPQTMTIKGRQTITLSDILVGDVWLCSGQSNMGRNVARSLIPRNMKWNHPRIRYWGAGKSEKYPIDRFQLDEPKPWTVCHGEESTSGCCAVGFFFARRVQQDVDVPIGILWQAWAGSIIQEWLPPDAWRLEPELAELADRVDAYYPNTPHGREVWKKRLAEVDAWMTKVDKSLKDETPFPYPQPLMPEPKDRDLCGFYNGKIHPLVPFAIKGVLWYQGESDMRNALWDIELKAMAQSWRDLFDVDGNGDDIPFYWAQIQRSGDYCSPLVRQQQFNGLKLIPHSGMAVLLDLDVDVHPRNKVDTGIRLALWALHRDYRKKDVVPSGPLYNSHRVQGNKVIVDFDFARGGLRIGEKDLLHPPQFADTQELPNVELAGTDKKWYPAAARIEGSQLVVISEKVPAPRHVRYCYTNIPDPPFLYNTHGLPAAMFTTLER